MDPNSIVDYLKSIGQDSSFSKRAQLAAQYGISGYTGSSSQNTQLLNALKSSGKTTTTPTTTSTTNTSTNPGTSSATSYSSTVNNVAGVDINKILFNTINQNSVSSLRSKIASGQLTPDEALQSLRSDFISAQQAAAGGPGSGYSDLSPSQINSIKASLFQPMDVLIGGTKPGRLNIDGSISVTATTVNKSTTGAGGTSSTASFVMPINVTQNLGPGSTGQDVTELQNWLKKQGFFPTDQAATGYYGDITRNAVAAWQKSQGLSVPANELGYFGPISRNALAQYGIKTTPTSQDDTLFNSEGYKALPPDQQAVVKSIFDAVSANDTDMATKLKTALDEAKKYADPYFAQQVSIALDGLTRGFQNSDSELNYNVTSASQKLDDLRKTISESKGYLTLDQQANLRDLELSYQQELEKSQNDLAATGFGDSSRRTKTEGLLSTTKGNLVESTNRAFAQKVGALDTTLSTTERDTTQEIARMREIASQNKMSAGRQAEGLVGSDNVSSIPGYTPLGGVTGSIKQNYYNDILSAANKFVF